MVFHHGMAWMAPVAQSPPIQSPSNSLVGFSLYGTLFAPPMHTHKGEPIQVDRGMKGFRGLEKEAGWPPA